MRWHSLKVSMRELKYIYQSWQKMKASSEKVAGKFRPICLDTSKDSFQNRAHEVSSDLGL